MTHPSASQVQGVANRIAVQIERFRAVIAMMPPESRVLIFQRIESGYCRECGFKMNGVCYCQNDE